MTIIIEQSCIVNAIERDYILKVRVSPFHEKAVYHDDVAQFVVNSNIDLEFSVKRWKDCGINVGDTLILKLETAAEIKQKLPPEEARQ